MLANSGGKITVLQPEGGGLFDILAGRYSDKANFDVWLHGYSEEELRIDRKGSGTVFVPRASINAVLTTQPEVIEKLSSIEGARGRGLLGRFLYSMPKSNVGYRPYKNTPIDPIAREDYRALVRAVLSIPDPLKGELREPADPYMLHVEGEALEIYRKLHDQIEEEMREGGPLAGIADFANKLPGSAARLAGILHVADHACHAADFVINVMGAGRHKKKVNPTTTVGMCKCDGKPEKVQISPTTMISAWSLALYFWNTPRLLLALWPPPRGCLWR